jgi:hypothetical protein
MSILRLSRFLVDNIHILQCDLGCVMSACMLGAIMLSKFENEVTRRSSDSVHVSYPKHRK